MTEEEKKELMNKLQEIEQRAEWTVGVFPMTDVVREEFEKILDLAVDCKQIIECFNQNVLTNEEPFEGTE
jgi:hypothetical protein